MYLRRAGGTDQQKPTTLTRLWRPSLGDPTAGSPVGEVLSCIGKEGPVELRADPCGGVKERVDGFLHCTNTFPTAFPPKGLPTPTFLPPSPGIWKALPIAKTALSTILKTLVLLRGGGSTLIGVCFIFAACSYNKQYK